MTPARAKLLEDARAAGYVVEDDQHGSVLITRMIGRWNKKTGVIIYPDGTAFRVDIRMDAATGIRSYRKMREILGLPLEEIAQ